MNKQNIIIVLLAMLWCLVTQVAELRAQTLPSQYGASIINGEVCYGHQADKPFAMHSVMKFPQALYIADYLNKKGQTLGDSVLVCKDCPDAETWSPMLAIFEGARYFTFAELIEWSLKQSDNNACDLLFASCGLPNAVEKYIHSLGFKDIHVRLTEKEVAEIAEQCLMRIQADEFLQNMPPDLQHKQTLAILKAIDGDNTELMAVRNSRNALPKYSDNVETKMISKTMRIYEPKGSQDCRLPILLYLHGGGWTFGSINSCGRFCNAMAASGEMRVIALDYRLAPEHPYPEGLNDCIEAVNYIINHASELHIDVNHITIGGDSSGGNLALATALSETCRGKIESLLLFYPVTKAFDDGSESWQQYGKGFGLDAEIMEAFNRAYTINADNRCSAISVGLCSDDELNMLPRILLIAAERDILRDQGKEFAERVRSKGTRIEYKGAVHLFITVPGQDAAFDRAVKDAITFIMNSGEHVDL